MSESFLRLTCFMAQWLKDRRENVTQVCRVCAVCIQNMLMGHLSAHALNQDEIITEKQFFTLLLHFFFIYIKMYTTAAAALFLCL